MIQLVVTRLISETWGGTIFAGRTADGQSRHVRTWQQTPIFIGDAFEVEGPETIFRGKWNEVRQIEATQLRRVRTSGRLIVPWLKSLDGIGQERADRLFECFGPRLTQALADPGNLSELADALAPGRPNVGRKLAEYLQLQFGKRAAREDIGLAEVEFLQKLEELGISDVALARKLWRLIGSRDAYQRLLERPYATAAVLAWKDADALGQRLLAAKGTTSPEDHVERQLGAVDAAWLRILKRGDTAITRTEMAALLHRLGVAPASALDLGLKHRRAIPAGESLLRAPGAAYLEAVVAAHIRRLGAGNIDQSAGDGIDIVPSASLTEEQAKAVHELHSRRFGVLQGGAGVGKTTTLRALCDAHASTGGRILLAAISGKAALRLSRATGRLAYTVARLVNAIERRAALEDEGKAVSDELPAVDESTLLVVDEASMVDLVSWKRLLNLAPTGARFIIVGDVAQLPPVGLGRVYHDLVEDGRDVATLTTVMRQAGGSPIINGAAAIRHGKLPSTNPYEGAGVGLFHHACSPGMLQSAALSIYNELLEDTPREQLLMLAARNDTCAAIAKSLQASRLEQGLSGVRIGPLAQWATIGDPVIATVNRYDQALMNGLMGWIESLDPLLVRFDGEEEAREVSGPARFELASAWCLTVHRAQGSEARRVIVLLDGPTLITREWLYTAVTRGIEQVVLVGPLEKLQAGLDRRERRTTGFRLDLEAANSATE